jgi:hypothetical protein
MAPARGEDAETIPSASSNHADDVVSPNKGTELSKKHDLPEDPSSENSSPATGYSAKTPTEDGEIVTSGNDETWVEPHSAVREPSGSDGIADAPPLPAEEIPPLPAEVPPGATEEDDGWAGRPSGRRLRRPFISTIDLLVQHNGPILEFQKLLQVRHQVLNHKQWQHHLHHLPKVATTLRSMATTIRTHGTRSLLLQSSPSVNLQTQLLNMQHRRHSIVSQADSRMRN